MNWFSILKKYGGPNYGAIAERNRKERERIAQEYKRHADELKEFYEPFMEAIWKSLATDGFVMGAINPVFYSFIKETDDRKLEWTIPKDIREKIAKRWEQIVERAERAEEYNRRNRRYDDYEPAGGFPPSGWDIWTKWPNEWNDKPAYKKQVRRGTYKELPANELKAITDIFEGKESVWYQEGDYDNYISWTKG